MLLHILLQGQSKENYSIALERAAPRSMDEFRALLQANPLLATTFTLDSPEVKEVCVA